MLKIHSYTDGSRRVAIRTEATLTARTIAACIAAEIAPFQGVTDGYRADLRDLTKTGVEELVREDVRVYGEGVYYRADNVSMEAVDLAEQRVLELFPDFAE